MQTKETSRNITRGFSLIESLISLALFLFILVISFEFFISTRNHFFNLREDQERNQAAYATLDKIRLDICESGRGLLTPQSYGLLEAIRMSGDSLIIQSRDRDLVCDNNLVAGQTYLSLTSTTGIHKHQALCIYDREKGELNTVISVDSRGVVLASPLNSSYTKEEAEVILIRTISFYLDINRGILRRKVNTSAAQPLLEDVALFDFVYDAAFKIVSLRLTLTSQEEKEYEISVFSKNLALVPTP
jgi:prepilin-type N-terminal cleavage/methylation domain-containing protein